jgi:hypothetical protein
MSEKATKLIRDVGRWATRLRIEPFFTYVRQGKVRFFTGNNMGKLKNQIIL